MARLNITGQRSHLQQVLPYFNGFRTQMDKRKTVWDKLSPEQRRKWVKTSNTKQWQDARDPVLWLAIQLKQYLDQWEIEDGDD